MISATSFLLLEEGEEGDEEGESGEEGEYSFAPVASNIIFNTGPKNYFFK